MDYPREGLEPEEQEEVGQHLAIKAQ